jgi:hypothetical protein
MTDWKSVLKADPIDWLLEKSNPSVRYFTLIELLDRTQDDSEVKDARDDIMSIGTVPKILAVQKEGGYWEKPRMFYTFKYKGTVWQLIILAELEADGKDERARKACEFIIENSQDHESGSFSVWPNVRAGGGRYSGVLPCLTGNIVWSLIRLGYLDDPRVKRGIDWIAAFQRYDDGEMQPLKGLPYDRLTSCFGKHSCHMGVVKSLKALAEIPPEKRSNEVMASIEHGAEYLLKHRIYKRSHDLTRVSKPGWLRLGFPLMYQTDILEILGILTKLGYKDERLKEAFDIVISKQDQEGRWKLESTFNGKFQTNIEQGGKQSKWITLKALVVIKKSYS